MKKALLFLLLAGSAFSTFAVDLQVNVEKYYNELANMYGQHVYITSMEDRVIIQDVLINKGNCRIGTAPKNYKRVLGFGQKVRVTPFVGCSVIQIKVTTDKGTQIYSVR